MALTIVRRKTVILFLLIFLFVASPITFGDTLSAKRDLLIYNLHDYATQFILHYVLFYNDSRLMHMAMF